MHLIQSTLLNWDYSQRTNVFHFTANARIYRLIQPLNWDKLAGTNVSQLGGVDSISILTTIVLA